MNVSLRKWTLRQRLNFLAVQQAEKKFRASTRQRPAVVAVANQIQRGEAVERFEANIVHCTNVGSNSAKRVAKFVVSWRHKRHAT